MCDFTSSEGSGFWPCNFFTSETAGADRAYAVLGGFVATFVRLRVFIFWRWSRRWSIDGSNLVFLIAFLTFILCYSKQDVISVSFGFVSLFIDVSCVC